jgi:hypothetical protein
MRMSRNESCVLTSDSVELTWTKTDREQIPMDRANAVTLNKYFAPQSVLHKLVSGPVYSA